MNASREISGGLSTAALLALPRGSSFRLRVAGSSMRPTLLDGDEIVGVRTGSPSEWTVGDMLVVDQPEAGLVVHRLLWAGARGVRTRGDGSGFVDRSVPAERVVGRIVAAQRDGRNVGEGALRRRWSWARAFAAAGTAWILIRLGLRQRPGGSGHPGQSEGARR